MRSTPARVMREMVTLKVWRNFKSPKRLPLIAVYGFNVQDLGRINDDLDISLCSGQLLPGAVHKAKDLFHLLGKALIPEDQFVFALVDLFYRVFHCVIPFCFGLVVILSAS